MRISFRQASVECRAWQSRRELERYLAGFDHSKMMTEPSEFEQEFYSVALEPDFRSAGTLPMALGLGCLGLGLQPQLLILPERNALWLGADNAVIGVDVATGEELFQTRFESVFYAMVHLGGSSRVLVLHELGATMLAEDGQALWTFDAGDVVEGASIEGRLLHLSLMDSEAVVLDLTSGAGVGSAGASVDTQC